MKKVLYSATLAFAAGVMTSCSDNDDVISSVAETPLQLFLDQNDEYVTSRTIYTGTTLSDNEKVGICTLKSDNSAAYKTGYLNLPYYVSSNALQPGESSSATTKTQVMLNSSTANIYSYFPYSSSYTTLDGLKKVTISAGTITDYMYGTALTASDHDASKSVVLNHALARIKVTIKKGSFAGTGTITNIKIAGNIASSGTMNILDGSVSATAGSYEHTWSATATTDGVSTEFLVVPTSKAGTAGNVTLTATVDSQTYTCSAGSYTIASGNYYTFILTITEKGLTISSVSVTQWPTATSVTGDLGC